MNRLLDLADPTVPDAQDCVLAHLLRQRAAEDPDGLFIETEPDVRWSNSDVVREMDRLAAGLQRYGVVRGDRVVSWLPNHIEGILLMFATSAIGATFVGLNTAYRGSVLEHTLRLAGAKLAVVHHELVERLGEIDTGVLSTLVVVGGAAAKPPAGVTSVPWSALPCDAALVDDGLETQPWDTFAIIFTSGTTGPSKAVLSSYVHHYTFETSVPEGLYRAGERVLFISPLFHLTGTAGVLGALLHRYALVHSPGFETATFWENMRRRRVDVAFLFAPMASFLLQAPPDPSDRDHPLRAIVSSPLTADVLEFGRRYGTEVYTAYAMSEIASPIASGAAVPAVGGCGTVQPGVEARLVDAHDREVARGEVGELILRPVRPWSSFSGYDKDPEATANAWRNGWFHTGDAFRLDEDGTYFFVDRVKDAIRRRGENISSFELEREVLTHPGVLQAAAVAVRSDVGDDEVLVALTCRGDGVAPRELVEYLIPRLPYFMVPRYVRVLDELPLTPSARVQKHVLRREGVTADTFDRESVGIRLRRERLD